MKVSELIERCEYKPFRMECCIECAGKLKSLCDCSPNPLNCIDFCIANHKKLKELGFDVFNKERDTD